MKKNKKSMIRVIGYNSSAFFSWFLFASQPSKSKNKNKMADHVIGTNDSDIISDTPAIKRGVDVLRKIQIKEYCSLKDCVCLDKGDTVPTLVKTLKEKRIQSVPVRDTSRVRTQYTFVDVLDLLVHSLNIYEKKNSLDEKQTQEAFGSISLSDLSNLSGGDPYSGIGLETSTEAAIKKFSRWKAHRLPVLDTDGELVMVLSQSGVLEFIQGHSSKFECASKTIKDFELGFKKVCSINQTDSVADAFRLMVSAKVSGLAILDESGAATGAISTSDIKHVIHDGILDLSLFDITVKEFKEKTFRSDKVIPGLLSISPDTTIEETILKFCSTKVHRLFIADGKKILGIVSVIDLLDLLVAKH